MLGGYALGSYGYPRATNDLDVFVSDEEVNVENLIRCLVQFGFGGQISHDAFARPRSIVEMGVEPIKIQLMNFADGLDFEAAFARRKILEIEGIEVSVVSKDDLIQNKKTVGRHKDLADVERLEKMA
jgi:hypothetical protein